MTTVHRGRGYFVRLGVSAAFVAAVCAAGTIVKAQSSGPTAPVHPPKAPKPGVAAPGVVRPMTNITPQASYVVEGSPDWSVVTDKSVWVSSSRVNHVVELIPQKDGQAGKTGIVATVLRPCSGLAYGWGSVWAPSCGSHALVRLDEATGKPVAQISADPANSEGGITIGEGSVWLVTKPSVLVRIDPTTNAIVSKLELPVGAENPAFGNGFVWISSFQTGQLLKIDPRQNKIVATINVGPKPRFLTVGTGSVWTLNQGDGSVSRVDMKSSKLTATIACGIPGEGGEITFGADSVWATMFEFPITQIDPKSNQPVKQWKGKGGDGLRFGMDSLWLSNGALGSVWRISPEQKSVWRISPEQK